MDVSVVVASRNRCDWLDACLECLTAQTTEVPFEIVVVDNASTDETPSVIARWVQRDGRVRGVREERLGLSAAKNAGLDAARGRAVLFTDDDVVVPEGWIDAYARALRESGGEALLGGPISPIADDLCPWPRWLPEAALSDVGRLDYGRTRPLLPEEYVWGANMGAPRAVLDRIGRWDETVGRRGDEQGTFEDTEYQDRARAAGIAVWFCAADAIQHRVTRGSVTPRRVLRTTFLRAAVDRRLDRRRVPTSGRPGPTAAVVLVGGAARLATAVVWAVAFRVAPLPGVFRRAHSAAWRAGWSIEVLDDEGRGGRWQRAAAAYGRRLLVAALRVTPDRASRPGPA